MMEAEKSHDLPSENWRVKRSSSSFPPKLSPKAIEVEKPWTKPEYSDLISLILRARRNTDALVQTVS